MNKPLLYARRIVLVSACVAASAIPTNADVQTEYFWNDDPGIGHATTLALSAYDADGYSLSSIPTDVLPEGFNLLGIRSSNKGQWSPTYLTYVWNRTIPVNQIDAAEYFWDSDPGIGRATQIGNLADINNAEGPFSIDTSELPNGEHLLGIRVRSNGRWSTTYINRVLINPNMPIKIIGLEYFWGSDPGIGNATSVALTPSHEVEIDPLSLPFPDEVLDEYTLSMRLQTNDGWGPTYTWSHDNIPVTDINVAEEDISLNVDDTKTLSANALPVDAFHPGIAWTSDNPEIVSVTSAGEVKAMAKGTTLLHATSTHYPSIEKTCRVTVFDQGLSQADILTDGEVTVRGIDGGILVEGVSEGVVTVYLPTGAVAARHAATPSLTIPAESGIFLVDVGGTIHKIAVP